MLVYAGLYLLGGTRLGGQQIQQPGFVRLSGSNQAWGAVGKWAFLNSSQRAGWYCSLGTNSLL